MQDVIVIGGDTNIDAGIVGDQSLQERIDGQIVINPIINGEVNSSSTLNGQVNLTQVISGEVGTFYNTSSEQHETYSGEYEVTPSTISSQILKTADKIMEDDVKVNKIPYWETSNEYGITIYIGNDAEV